MNAHRFPRTTSKAVGHAGHTIEQQRAGWTLLEVFGAVTVVAGWLLLLWWALCLLVGQP